MKKYILIVFIMLFISSSFGQKKVETNENEHVQAFIEKLPENLNKFKLKDLQKSTDSLNIRIWQTHTVFTLNCNHSVSSNYTIHTTNDKPTISSTNFTEDISRCILDSILDFKLLDVADDSYRGIDGSFVFIEISTKNTYKVVSFWSPMIKRSDDCKTLVNSLYMINKTINSSKLINEFKNSLEPGGYRWGMTSLQIDKFLGTDTEKTDFYCMAEERIKSELNISEETNRWEYPLLLVNGTPAKLAALNQYSGKDVEAFEVLKPNNSIVAIYGTNGSNGVIKVKTK